VLELEWGEAARADLLGIIDYIADDNANAATELLMEIEQKVERLRERPKLYRRGRVPGTRELVVRPNYIVVYAEDERAVVILPCAPRCADVAIGRSPPPKRRLIRLRKFDPAS
jgi:toxin ParE1/3/4